MFLELDEYFSKAFNECPLEISECVRERIRPFSPTRWMEQIVIKKAEGSIPGPG